MSADEQFCHRCGAEADGEMDGKLWCASCLHIEGSCCADDSDANAAPTAKQEECSHGSQ